MKNGIVSYGAYVPRHRLRQADIASALGGDGGKGSRAIAGYDEDSTTLGVEAARRACAGRTPAAIYFATTSPPYFDKTNASAIHAALGSGHQGLAIDLAGSTRCAVGAMRAAALDGGLAVLADIRTGRPGSSDERGGGDAGAAILFGSEDPLAEIIGEASATAEFLDRWRVPGGLASDHWEERFGMDAYRPLIDDVASRALAQAGIDQVDHVIVSSPHARAAAAGAARLQGKVAEKPPTIGYSGTADPGLRLAAVLDRARPGDTVLWIVAADGADALVFRVTERIESARPVESVVDQSAIGRDVLYPAYLTWRGLLEREPPRRPAPERPAAPPSARSEAWKFSFVGSGCTVCGQVHVPPRRVCAGCGAVDQMEPQPLADRVGTVATYTVDRLAFSPSPPTIDAVVDFDGGGRYTLEVTDAAPEEVDIGTRLELTFRRLYSTEGVHNYFWKVRPLGAPERRGD